MREKIQTARNEMHEILRRVESLTRQKEKIERDLNNKLNERICLWRSEW